jgi:hypothetical protein
MAIRKGKHGSEDQPAAGRPPLRRGAVFEGGYNARWIQWRWDESRPYMRAAMREASGG